MKAFSFFAFCTLLSLSLSNAHASSIVGSWKMTNSYCESSPTDTLEGSSLMSTALIQTESSSETYIFDDQMNFLVSGEVLGDEFPIIVAFLGIPTQKTNEELAACMIQANFTYATSGNQLTISAPHSVQDLLKSPNCSAEISVLMDRFKLLLGEEFDEDMKIDFGSDFGTVEFEVSTDGQTMTFSEDSDSCGANDREITEFTRINN